VRKGWNLGTTIDANENILEKLEKLVNIAWQKSSNMIQYSKVKIRRD
jgi:hypothetical protein